MQDCIQQYRDRRCTAQTVAGKVKSGDKIFFGEFARRPQSLDEAIAQRVNELEDVVIEGVCVAVAPKCVEADPHREHFIYDDWHFSTISRRLSERGLCSYIPLSYHQGPRVIRKYKMYDFVFVSARPMDAHGYFNFGLANSITSAAIEKGTTIVIEVNESLPTCLGGAQESVHISRVDYVVEGNNAPISELRSTEPTDTDTRIGQHIMPEIEDGACLQFGIGGLPNVIGSMIAGSDLKNLGVHTEMIVDSMVDLDLAGKITGSNKTIDPFKIVYTFAMGTKRLYDHLDNNPGFASYPQSCRRQ
jgi:acyl-CoA hydrolase